MAKSKLAKIHAILGRSHRTGRWRLSPKTSVIAFLGSCRLDLREAKLDGDVSKMSATVVLGGVTIIIPPGVEVRPSGLSLLGGASVDVPPFDDDGDATSLIEIEWTSIFGRLRIGAETDLEAEETEADGADEPASVVEVASIDRAPDQTVAEGAGPALAPTTGLDAPDQALAASSSAAVAYEDLDEAPTTPADAPAAIGFDDLDEPTPAPDDTPNRRSDDPEPSQQPETVDEEPEPAALGFDDL